jgi:transcription antitermination factor NusG
MNAVPIIEQVATNTGRHAVPGDSDLPAFVQPHWYAVYTRANHERRVAEQLACRGIERFLPEYESVRKWKDREVRLQMPLFQGYVFVHLALCDRLQVLRLPGVAKLVGFNGMPAPLPEEEIQALKAALADGVRAKPHPFLKLGRRVRVKMGPLSGLEGVLLRRKNRTRFIISLEMILRSVAVEVDEVDLEGV